VQRGNAGADQSVQLHQNARNSLLTLEDLTEDQLRQIKATFAALAVGGTGLPGEIREVRKDLAQAGQDLEEAETKLARAEVQTVALLAICTAVASRFCVFWMRNTIRTLRSSCRC
jgi:ribosomal protein L29